MTRIDAVPLGGSERTTTTFFSPVDHVHPVGTTRKSRRVRRQRWRAALDGLCARAEHALLPIGVVGARIQILPFQLEPWFAFRNGARRVLIADAVGLGKTVQAGVVLAELHRRGEAKRALILAPGHLCAQWTEQLHELLGLALRHTDARTLTSLATTLPRSITPWSLEGISVASIDFVKQRHVAASLPPDPWDLLIIDEAHALTHHTDRRAICDRLARLSRRVLLLTATPHSGLDDGRALLRLGAWAKDDELTVFRRTREDVGIRSVRRARSLCVFPDTGTRAALDTVLAFRRAALRATTKTSGTQDAADVTHLLVSIFTKRALSTCHALRQSLHRRLQLISSEAALTTEPAQLSLFDDDEGMPAGESVLGPVIERSWLSRMLAAATRAVTTDRKLERLRALIRRAPEPVIVFTEFRDSLEVIAGALSATLPVAVAYGGMSPSELAASLAMFLRGDARVLVATDVASQGLNLHARSRWVIHYDLPWNPIRLEQRAGRVDRIGQTRSVHVTSLRLAHAIDAEFGERLSQRTSAAVDATAALGVTHWRRRARAAAIVLTRRRGLASHWRGHDIVTRPWRAAHAAVAPRRCDAADAAEHARVSTDATRVRVDPDATRVQVDSTPTHVRVKRDTTRIRVVDVLGVAGPLERVVSQETDGPATSLHARVRRVQQLAGAAARRAAAVERALLTELGAPEASGNDGGDRATEPASPRDSEGRAAAHGASPREADEHLPSRETAPPDLRESPPARGAAPRATAHQLALPGARTASDLHTDRRRADEAATARRAVAARLEQLEHMGDGSGMSIDARIALINDIGPRRGRE